MPKVEELDELPPLEEMEELEAVTRASRPAAPSSTSSVGSRSAKTSPRKPAKVEPRGRALEEIRTGVEDLFVTLGSGLSPFVPVTGTVMVSRAPVIAERMVRLSEQDPRVMKAMLRFIKYNAYLGVGEMAVVLGVAVAVDLHQLGPEGLIPSKMIGKEIELVYTERQRAASAASVDGAGVPEPQWVGPPG